MRPERWDGVRGREGFSLVGLVVTLTIVATLSGVAAIFYDNLLEDQKQAIVANELGEYSTALRAYLVRHGKVLSSSDPSLIEIRDIPNHPRKDELDKYADGFDGYLFQFLVDEGIYDEIRFDPWGHVYRFDPDAGAVYSLGPDAFDPGDDIRRTFSSGASDRAGEQAVNPLPVDQVPPVISQVQPVGVIKIPDPQVRASFYDHFGGTIVQESAQLFIDGQDAAGLDAQGVGTLTTNSAGQIIYTTNERFSERVHNVVVQVKDGAGNLSRREWSFVVDTKPAIARVLNPVQGSAIRDLVDVQVYAEDDNLFKVTIRRDFANVTDEFRGIAPSPLGALPPQNGEATSYTGEWANMDTRDLEDGTHFFTVNAEDGAGRVISDQVEVTIDNEAPTLDFVLAVDPQGQPPAGASPQIIPNPLPHFEVRGRDNIGLKEILYGYEKVGGDAIPSNWDDIDVVPLDMWQGTRGSQLVSSAEVMVPVEWAGEPANDWASFFNSGDEIASTTAVSIAAYTPVTLGPGAYFFRAKAIDLAGNESSIVSTRFLIDLTEVGIVGLEFVDRPRVPGVCPCTPVAPTVPGIAGQTISGLRADLSPLNASLFSSQEATGHLRFDLLRVQPGSEIKALINDFHRQNNRGGFDGLSNPFVSSTSYGDWYTTMAMPLTSGVITMADYEAHGDLVTPFGTFPPEGAPGGRREGVAVNLPHGPYQARVDLDFAAGEDKFALTTYYVDSAFPDYQDPDTLMQQFASSSVGTVDAFISNLYSSSPPTIRLGGILVDRLGLDGNGDEFARVVTVEARRHNTPGRSLLDPNDWVQVFPRGSEGPARVATYGWVDGVPGAVAQSTMTITSASAAALDGPYVMDFRAVDGAGHTTAWSREFTVNTVGPVITSVVILNGQSGAVALDSSSGPSAVTTIQEPLLRFQIDAQDERDVSRIEFRITEIGGLDTLGTSLIPILPPQLNPPAQGPIEIFRDQVGSVFRSAPTSYLFEAFATNIDGTSGPTFTTRVQFRYLVDLAIFAPHIDPSGAADTDRVAVSKAEQAEISGYLLDNVENVRSIAIFNTNGKVSEEPAGEVPETNLPAWVSANAADGTTDILVVLDALHSDLWTNTIPNPADGNNPDRIIEVFLESADGDVVIFSGGASMVSTMFDSSGNRVDPTGGISNWNDLLDASPSGNQFGIHAAEGRATAGSESVQRSLPRAQMLIPSLPTHEPAANLLGGAANQGYVVKSPLNGLGGASSPPGWGVLELFTQDSGKAPFTVVDHKINDDNSDTSYGTSTLNEGGSFVLQNTNLGKLAVFMSYGRRQQNSPIGYKSNRTPTAVVGAVIEEFIENYLSASDQPDAVESKVAFVSKGLGALTVPTTSTSEVDALLWPKEVGGEARYAVLSPTIHRDHADSQEVFSTQDITPDGGQVLAIAREQDSPDDVTITKANLGVYVFTRDGTRTPLYRNNQGATDKGDPRMARFASDSAKAVVVGAVDQDLDGANDLVNSLPFATAREATWLYDLGAGTRTRITDVRAGVGDRRADVSGTGRYVVTISELSYRGSDGPGNAWAGAITTSPAAVMRFDSNLGNFAQGYVNDPNTSNASPPASECSGFFQKVEPMDVAINGEGDVVIWTARPLDASCMNNSDQLLISRNVGGTWRTGKITNCGAAGTPACDFGKLLGFEGSAEVLNHIDLTSGNPEGSFPWVVFSARADFRGQGATCSGCNTNVKDSPGTTPRATARPARGIWLWRGSFTCFTGSAPLTCAQFIQVADAPDGGNGCRNPRISPNGGNSVFECDANKVEGLLSYNFNNNPDTRRVSQTFDVTAGFTRETAAASWPTGNGTGTGEGPFERKVFRSRLKPAANTVFGINASLQLVAPPDDTGSLGRNITVIPDPDSESNPFLGAQSPVVSN